MTEDESKYDSGVSELNQLIMTHEGDRYFISDWYSLGTISFDETVRGDQKKISDFKIWDDQNFVYKINKKLN